MWHPAMNRWHDQTGIAHVLVTVDGVARPLCGARPYSLGGGFQKAEDSGSHECRRCRAPLNRYTHGKAPSE